MNEILMYGCDVCGNIVTMVNDSGVIPYCCGGEMKELVSNTADTGVEKHLPVVRQTGSRVEVTIGRTAHPMNSEHHIEWILLVTDRGAYIRKFEPQQIPTAMFTIRYDEDVLAAYAYCNLHGLWRVTL